MEIRARAFLVQVRGTEDTSTLSGRLGYTSDVVAEWEAGRRWPTAGEALRVCAARRIDVPAALRRFDPDTAHLYRAGDDADVAAWIRGICGRADARRMAGKVGRPVAVVRRWMGGQVRPLLPDLLNLVQASTGRAEDLLQELMPRPQSRTPDHAPDQRARQRTRPALDRVSTALQAARQLRASVRKSAAPAPDRVAVPVPAMPDDTEDEVTVEVFGGDGGLKEAHPARDQVWRAVASPDHTSLGHHRPGWLEARTGLPTAAVTEALTTLESQGHVRWVQDRWQAVDQPADARNTRAAKREESSLERLRRRRGAQIAVSVSQEDLERIRSLERRTRDELHAIAAASRRQDVLALVRVDA